VLEIGLLGILDELVEDQPVDVVVVAEAGERVGRHLSLRRPVLPFGVEKIGFYQFRRNKLERYPLRSAPVKYARLFVLSQSFLPFL
jgi:hypothetical protein